MLTSKLAIGPMSKEIIEAVFRFSGRYKKQLMLICSLNQVHWKGGYVFTTSEYAKYIANMRQQYPDADVVICRDHCGPGFAKEVTTFRDVIISDIEYGFDLIHIDLCHLQGNHQTKLQSTISLMELAKQFNSKILFEIGTDENIGEAENDVDRVTADIEFIKKTEKPEFYVVQTGSLVRENYQAGIFNEEKVNKLHEIIHYHGIKLKEHNADYLSDRGIKARQGLVDAVNIAPQLGVVQTNYVLSQALIYGIDTQSFIDEVIRGDRWRKWVDPTNNPQRMLNTLVAGHYHFNGSNYSAIINKLDKLFDIRQGIVDEVTQVIEHYMVALGEVDESCL